MKVTFECDVCGYQEFLGETNVCPVCRPIPETEEVDCFLLRVGSGVCGIDGIRCSHVEKKNYDECPKLSG